jgi:O-antigen ligase/polysaccharide polymerase Wzy-like membrane protein
MSASALPTAWTPAGLPDRARRLPPAVPVAAAGLLGAAIATQSPILIALALAPLGLAAIARPTGAVLVFAFGFYLNVPVLVAHDLHMSSALSTAFAMLLVLPFLTYVVVGRRPLVVTPALALMVAYLVVLVLSAAIGGGGDPSTVGPIVTFLGEGLLLYVLVSNVVRTPAQLRAVMWTLVLAGALMGLISVWQELTHSYSTTLGGLAQVDKTGFDVQTPLQGVQHLHPRLAGPIGEKNRYAQLLLVLVPLAVSRARSERERRLRLLAAGCAALILCGVLLTFSRGAAVAMLLLVVAMGVLRQVSLRQLLAMALALVALVAVVAPDYAARVQSLAAVDGALSTSGAADGAIVGRATENLAALYVFRDHPALGVGPGQFFRRYSAIYGNALDLRYLKTNRRAHNLYLEIAADTGALGLAAFLAIVAVTMAQLWRLTVFWRSRDADLASLSRAFLLAIVAYLATGIFLQLAYERYFWFLLALANATVWMLGREAARRSPDHRHDDVAAQQP